MTFNGFPAGGVLAACALLATGCAAEPAQVRVPEEPGARSCLILSKKCWERDVLESLRYLRRGAELRDAECCRQYLAAAESATVNLSQRLYARLFVERILRGGPVRSESGVDARAELYYQLCWSWRSSEPISVQKAKQVLEDMIDAGAPPSLVGRLIRETGLPGEAPSAPTSRQDLQLYAGEAAGDARRWLRVPRSGESRGDGSLAVMEACAWGGGTDRLYLATNVLAFLVNARGEPSFRGDHLWIANLGNSSVFLSSLVLGQSNREVAPGHEDLLPLTDFSSKSSTGIPLSVRYRRSER